MRKIKSIFVISSTVLGLLLVTILALAAGSASAQTPKEAGLFAKKLAPATPADTAVSLSNYDAAGNFRYLSGPQAGAPLAIALDFIRSHSEALGVTDSDLADLVVTDQYVSQHTGITHIYLQQQYEGIAVQNGRININIAADGSVINLGNRLAANLAQSVNTTTPAISAETAVQAAAQQLNLTLSEALAVQQTLGGASQAAILSDGGISQNAIPVSLVYEAASSGAIQLAWNIEIYELSSQHWWVVNIDALTSDMLSQIDYVNNESWHDNSEHAPQNPDEYTVFSIPKESPYDGPRTVEMDPADATASPFGWHDTDGSAGAEFTTTQGNNTHAYTDIDANNSPDPGSSPDGGASLVFSYTFDIASQPDTYRPAAVTNLFYWNNIMHDVMYLYGFDEPAGNFQENNYGNGGLGSDYVYAEAQDGSGTNNANFATPPDGSNPRMQMYVWTNPFAQLVTVNSPGPVVGSYIANPSNNGGNGNGLTADLEIVDDGVAPTNDGCETITNDLTGKIALMVWSQGLCNSSVFVANAATAGAVGAIIIDATPIPFTNFGGTAAIPSVAIGSTDGQLFLTTIITNAQTINATLEDNPAGQLNRDSDLDNGVIAHEYGHGISNRLTGGPTNTGCLNNAEQMGEGWSDLMTLILHADASDTITTTRGIGNYVKFDTADGTGIRLFPYSTEFSVNPQTYNSIINNGTSPHSLGEVWALMYFEVYWNLVDKHGYNPNIYDDWSTGGNNLALQLLMDGMKLQPCSPGMVDGRDAILAADQALTNGDNQCEIWEGFAKRGLGVSADQGTPFSRTDGTEAFDLPAACTGAAPIIEVTPASLSSSQTADTQVTQSLVISNTGNTDLTWDIFEDASSGFGGSWSDNFDSYATGSQMHGQGGWKGWDNSPAAGAFTSNAEALSAPNSVDILGASDLVHEYSGYTSGQWIYTAWQFVPDTFAGTSYFIMLNTYADGGSNNWSVQVQFDSASNLVLSDNDGATLPLIKGQWVEIRLEIDLDADVQTFYYDGQMLYQKSWVDGVSGGGVANIAAVDLFANNASTVYYDDISLAAPLTTCDAADPIDWVSVMPMSGTVPALSATSVDVTFDSTGYGAGVYTGTLCINSNDATNPLISVPLTMTVLPNAAPVAADDAYTTTQDVVLTVSAPGVLANDTDGDGDSLTAVLNTDVTSGTLALNADGSFTYTPTAGFEGTATFTYQANDGIDSSNVATVTITVVNTAPVAVADSYTTTEGITLTVSAPGVLDNDSDADGDGLTADLNTTTANGTLTLNTDGSFTYVPDAGFAGTDSFTYHANDGTDDSDTVTVTITVEAETTGYTIYLPFVSKN
ncbi:MAG: M36 family metallopeptidase [Ardenticatenaceae bacterium]|nr:M36 family metallopeptidase [Ardenticatenaceae bacterium]